MASPRPPEPGRPSPGPPEPPEPGRLGLTRPGTLVTVGLTGLVLGWLVRPVSVRLADVAPTVGWFPAVSLWFLVAVVGSLAWSTYAALQRRRERMAPHQAVNRMVLGKACALVGVFCAGGYFGYALSWLGLANEVIVRERVLPALVTGLAGVLLMVGSLLLERACRIRDDEDAEDWDG